MFSSQSDLVKVTPVITPMLFSLNHRNFRCFRVGGPAHPVSLNLSAGPASQSLSFLLPRETAAPAPASSPVRHAEAAAPLHRRPLAPPPPPLTHCFTARTPLVARSTRTPAPPLFRSAAAHHRRRRNFLSRTASPDPHLHPRASIHARFEFPPPLVRVPARCSRNCLLGVFFVYFSTDTWISKGMVLPHLACVVSSSSYPFYTCLLISLP